MRLRESPRVGRRAAGRGRQTLRAQVNTEEQQEWSRNLSGERASVVPSHAWNLPAAPTKARIRSGFMMAEV